jgi:thioredoxin reductase
MSTVRRILIVGGGIAGLTLGATASLSATLAAFMARCFERCRMVVESSLEVSGQQSQPDVGMPALTALARPI